MGSARSLGGSETLGQTLGPLQIVPVPASRAGARGPVVGQLASAAGPTSGLPAALSCVQESLAEVRPAEIQSGIQGAIQSLNHVRSGVAQVSEQVNAFNAAARDTGRCGMAGPKRRKARRRPYSPFLAEPVLKINAAMGCLARIPLPSRAFPTDAGGWAPHPPPPAGMGRGSTVTRLREARERMMGAWAPFLKDTALRVFASGSITAQLGRFTRPVLDYTSACVRLDLGLTSNDYEPTASFRERVTSENGGPILASSGGMYKHRAFALEGRGTWHALSVSLAQQVIGPLRARADVRCALDPAFPQYSGAEGLTWRGTLAAVSSVRPVLLETVYGLDCVLPGTEGAARVTAWYSPMRREAMAEIKLF